MIEDKSQTKEEFPVFEFISKGIKTMVEAVILLFIRWWK